MIVAAQFQKLSHLSTGSFTGTVPNGSCHWIRTPDLFLPTRRFSFFPSCFLLCRGVGLSSVPLRSLGQHAAHYLCSFCLYDHLRTSGQRYALPVVDTGALGLQNPGKPGNSGPLGLDQNLLGFVLSQSLVLFIVPCTDSPVSPSLG